MAIYIYLPLCVHTYIYVYKALYNVTLIHDTKPYINVYNHVNLRTLQIPMTPCVPVTTDFLFAFFGGGYEPYDMCMTSAANGRF